MTKKVRTIVVITLALLGAFYLSVKVFRSSEQNRIGSLSSQDSQLFIRPHSPVKGGEGAKVYVIEFLDPECESCRAMYPATKRLLEEYDGKIKLVIRYIPFHQNSKFAIRVLEASRRQGKYWEALEVIFRNQPEWGNHHNPRPELIWNYLSEIQVDVKKVETDMNAAEINSLIAQDSEDAKNLGVRGTPTFFVNGKPVPGHGYEALKAAIDEALLKI